VKEIADELLDLMSVEAPLVATSYGLPGYDHLLADPSAQAEESLRAKAVDIANRARELDTEDWVTRAVVLQQAESVLDRLAARGVEYSITDSFFAPAAEVLSVLPTTLLANADQEQAYLSRLAAVPEFLAKLADRHRQGVKAGRTPVTRLVQATVAYLDRYLAGPDPLALPRGGPKFTAERDRLLTELVQPAFARYRDVLATEIAPHGRPTDRAGLCWLPGGEEIYAGLVRSHTTTDRSPQDLHQTGLDLMAELAQEYAEIGSRVFGTSSAAEVLHRMRTDPALRWQDATEMLTAARLTVERAEAVAPQWFGRVPDVPCVVEPVPDSQAPGAPLAYYTPAAMDGSRPGTYSANTHRPQERYRYQSEALAFHEAVPGHHFQISLAQGLTDLPMLRRIAQVNAYLEGWGLYCERLADEMGLYSDDVSRLGMLALDSMRAGRLVVDTGLHAHGWSRAQAVAYLQENTPLAQVEIESEVDRYIGTPGQALAYMVGRLEIQRIRAEAERTLADRFDIREFHDLVLGGGPLPLAVLATVVSKWITTHP
jgi:uncharacterized protein (DUF885 family)